MIIQHINVQIKIISLNQYSLLLAVTNILVLHILHIPNYYPDSLKIYKNAALINLATIPLYPKKTNARNHLFL